MMYMPKQSKKSYRKTMLPSYIEKLKNMVDKNFEIVVKPVECVITEDKFYNVLKGRRTAAEESVWGMKKVDSLYKELENLGEDEVSSYYREKLPELISNLKVMFSLNLEVIDIDLDVNEDDYFNLKEVEDDLKQMLGNDITKKILKNANTNRSVTEDKLHNVIKSRKTASVDCEWVLSKIDELQGESEKKEDEVKTSWSKKMASA